jgi:hypothetical protein
VWGKDNKTSFAPSKTHFTLISNKTKNQFDLCFPFPRIMFGGVPVKRKPAVKLVGYLFDEKLSWSGMIAGIAQKARMRLGMLSRLRPLLNDRNMETMYTTYIRPILEYGSVQFMGAAETHLAKLDAVQRAAERIGRFKVETLQSRREAAAISLTFKLLDGGGRGVLKNMLPTLVDHSKGKKRGRDTRGAAAGLQIQSRSKVYSLDAFKRSYLGSIHHIWAKLPQSLVREGEKRGWSKVTKRCKLHLMGKQAKQKSSDKRQKIAKQKVRVADNVNDGFDIGGFKANRVSEFEVDIKDYDMSLRIKVNSIYKKMHSSPFSRLVGFREV